MGVPGCTPYETLPIKFLLWKSSLPPFTPPFLLTPHGNRSLSLELPRNRFSKNLANGSFGDGKKSGRGISEMRKEVWPVLERDAKGGVASLGEAREAAGG